MIRRELNIAWLIWMPACPLYTQGAWREEDSIGKDPEVCLGILYRQRGQTQQLFSGLNQVTESNCWGIIYWVTSADLLASAPASLMNTVHKATQQGVSNVWIRPHTLKTFRDVPVSLWVTSKVQALAYQVLHNPPTSSCTHSPSLILQALVTLQEHFCF